MYIFFQHKKNVVEMVDENKKLYILLAKVISNTNERLELNGHFYVIFLLYVLYVLLTKFFRKNGT